MSGPRRASPRERAEVVQEREVAEQRDRRGSAPRPPPRARSRRARRYRSRRDSRAHAARCAAPSRGRGRGPAWSFRRRACPRWGPAPPRRARSAVRTARRGRRGSPSSAAAGPTVGLTPVLRPVVGRRRESHGAVVERRGATRPGRRRCRQCARWSGSGSRCQRSTTTSRSAAATNPWVARVVGAAPIWSTTSGRCVSSHAGSPSNAWPATWPSAAPCSDVGSASTGHPSEFRTSTSLPRPTVAWPTADHDERRGHRRPWPRGGRLPRS